MFTNNYLPILIDVSFTGNNDIDSNLLEPKYSDNSHGNLLLFTFPLNSIIDSSFVIQQEYLVLLDNKTSIDVEAQNEISSIFPDKGLFPLTSVSNIDNLNIDNSINLINWNKHSDDDFHIYHSLRKLPKSENGTNLIIKFEIIKSDLLSQCIYYLTSFFENAYLFRPSLYGTDLVSFYLILINKINDFEFPEPTVINENITGGASKKKQTNEKKSKKINETNTKYLVSLIRYSSFIEQNNYSKFRKLLIQMNSYVLSQIYNTFKRIISYENDDIKNSVIIENIKNTWKEIKQERDKIFLKQENLFDKILMISENTWIFDDIKVNDKKVSPLTIPIEEISVLLTRVRKL